MATIHEGYKTPLATAAASISMRQAIYWAKTNLVIPSLHRGLDTNDHHLYSFSDLVILRAVKRLKDSGISIQSLRKVAERLKAFDGATFANLYLTGDGKKDVLLRNQDELVSMLRNPGQIAFAWILNMADVEREVRQAVRKLEKAA